MCHPIIVGAAIGAATSAITGNDPLMGALIGGVTGGMGGLGGESMLAEAFGSTITGTTFGLSNAAIFGTTAIGLGGGMLMKSMTPQQQDYNYANTGLPYTPQAYSSQHTKVTGSGGRQAAAVLASEMKRAKSLRSRQAGAEDYGLGMDVTGTGLQIA